VNGFGQLTEKKYPDAKSFLSLLMHRRSYRRFLDKPISDENIEQLTKAATFIPSGGNDHRINITVLTSKEKHAKLLSAILEYYASIRKLLKNPMLRFIGKQIGDAKVKATLKDPFYFKKILRIIEDIKNEDDAVFYHAPAVFFFHTDRIMPTAKEDCILSAYNVVLMAETLKLGSCFVSLSQQAVTNDKKCKDILSIPHSHRVEAVVVIGHPKRIYKRAAYHEPKQVNFIS
jgi:nitroreductase